MIPSEILEKAKLLYDYEVADKLEDDEYHSNAPDRVIQFLMEYEGYNAPYVPEQTRVVARTALLSFLDGLDRQRLLPFG